MTISRPRRGGSRTASAKRWQALVGALAIAAFGAWASAASATVNIVSKTESGPNFYPTIQQAVNASNPHDWVLIEPGKYDESVRVETPGLHIRGLNRNTVIVDGQHTLGPKGEGRNGIEVLRASNASVENLTVRNFDRESRNGANGNQIWWNGGDGSGKIGAKGWVGAYLTTYDTGLTGGYGLFVSNSVSGSMENVYASGFNDSGLYIGACRDCKATVSKATVENSALGYSGTNAGGQLIIENSTFRHNTAGLVPNSLAHDDVPPPQDGACNSGENTSPTPKFESTKIKRCTIFRNNLMTENNNLTTPTNSTTGESPWGTGVVMPGTYADLLEGNTISKNVNVGVLGFEFPNPFPPGPGTIFFQFAGNKFAKNTFSENGTAGGAFAGDMTLEGGAFGEPPESTNNCVTKNDFTSATFPKNIEEGWSCKNKTTPNPGAEPFAYIVELSAQSQARTEQPQPAAPAQRTMPKPCKGVPKNALSKGPLCNEPPENNEES
jgi:hypothetical protein